ncbi:MAG: hypothetical protein PHO89_01355 [Methylacidiphilaceae bacterium]|nr:hypothetical protein [Candidatus Methylacidiphilaceae bacterium]
MRELVAACEQQRDELGVSLEELRTPVRLLEVGWRLAQVVRPGLQLFREVQEVWKQETPKKTRSSLLSAFRLFSWAERTRLALMLGRWIGVHLIGKGRRRA